MPDPTTNFGWDVPEVAGSNNAWGAQLNLVFDNIDADLKLVKTTADSAATDLVSLNTLEARIQAQQTIYVGAEILQPENDEDNTTYGVGSGAHLTTDFGKALFGALPPLPVGAVLNEVHMLCNKGTNTSATVVVLAVDAVTGAVTTVGTGTRSDPGIGLASAVALAHVIGAKFLKVKASSIGNQSVPQYHGFKILYTPAAL